MSFLSRAFTGARESRTLTSASWLNNQNDTNMAPGWATMPGEHTRHGDAMGLSSFYACVTLLADIISSFSLKSYRIKDGVQVPVSPQPTLFKNSPWPDVTWFSWLWMIMESLAITGNGFGYITAFDDYGKPSSIMPVHPDFVSISITDFQGTKWPKPMYTILGTEIPQDRMLHIKRYPIAGFTWGMSPVQKAASAIGLGLAAQKYGIRYFEDSANPSGLLTTEQDLTPEQAKQAMKRWIQSHQGRRLPALMSGGLTWQSIQVTPEESQFLQTRANQVSEVARFFRIPAHMIGDSTKATSWGCLPGDALVFTASGPVPIEDVKVGDEVWSFGDNGMEMAKVTNWKMTGHKPLLTIHTRGRELRLTSNHRVPVRRYFGQAEGRRASECTWETVEVSAGEIRPGDYLLVPHGMGDGDRDTAPNGRKLTVAAMELCGLYVGDGSRDGNRFEIAHERDPDHMDHYVGVVRSEFGVEPYTDKRGTRTRFSSVDARDLLECGFTGTALTKRIPDWVYRLKPELQLAFLRGYLDADGSVQKGAIVYSSASRPLLEDVRHLCIQLGLPVGKVIVGRKAGPMTIDGRTYHAQPKYQLSLTTLSHNSRIGSNSPRKASRFVTTTDSARWSRYDRGGRAAGRPCQTPGGDWSFDDVVLHKVIKIDTGVIDVPVYDIEVKGPAHFVSDGVLVHNSGIENLTLGFVKFTLWPWMCAIEQEVTRLLPGGQFAKFDIDELMRGDVQTRWESYRIGRDIGVNSANDILKMEGRPTIGPEGDIRLQPANFIPLGQENTNPIPTHDPQPVVKPFNKPKPADNTDDGEDTEN